MMNKKQFYVILVVTFLLSCSGNHDHEIITKKINSLSEKLCMPFTAKTQISNKECTLNFTENQSENLDEQLGFIEHEIPSNYLCSIYLNEIRSELEKVNSVNFSFYREDKTEIRNHSFSRVEIDENLQIFNSNEHSNEFLLQVFSKMRYKGYFDAQYNLEFLSKESVVLDFQGDFFEFLMDYSMSCGENNEAVIDFLWYSVTCLNKEYTPYNEALNPSLLYFIDQCGYSRNILDCHYPFEIQEVLNIND